MASVLFGLTHGQNIGTISKEKTFGLSMLSDQTQLVFLNEMMPADIAKIFLQRGMLTVSRKYADAEIVNNSAGKLIHPNCLIQK